MNLIIKHFEEYVDRYNKNYNHEISRKNIESHMQGYIISLELSGKNIEANICKELFEKLNR